MSAMTRWRLTVAMTSLILLGGCASDPEIVPSKGPRPATTPDQVRIYQEAPKRYEQLGTVTATADEGAKWDEKGDATAGYDTLRRKAAALGANGLLLKADKGDYDVLATAGDGGTFHQIPIRGRPATAVAQAIYVLKE